MKTKKEITRNFLLNIFMVSLILLMTSSVSFRANYDITLSEVERPLDAKKRYGDQKIIRFREEGKTKFSLEDEMVKIIWIPTSSEFIFKIWNKTDHSIKIIWDDAVYVDENGTSKHVTHSGVKYIDITNSQLPSTIVRGATISDFIIPTDNVYFSSGWRETPLFTNEKIAGIIEKEVKKELIDEATKYVGRSVQVLLPLKIEDVVNEYIFTFKINDFKIQKIEPQESH